MRGLLMLLAVTGAAVMAVDTDTWVPHFISCTEFPDGYHEVGCWGKAVCVNGAPVVTVCASHEMFDAVSDSCVNRTLVSGSTACNIQVDCTQKTGRFADLNDGCRTYFICLEGSFYGRQYCPPLTIFNEVLQICDYVGDTPPPCGTYRGTYASTPNGPWPEYTVVG